MAKQNSGAFKKNNEIWKKRKKHGKDLKFESAEKLWNEACKYFRWVDGNPLYEMELFHYQGKVTEHQVAKKRPYTMEALCIFLGASTSYFREFKRTQSALKAGDYLTVIAQIEETVYAQKFEGAASGFFNSNLIAASLGLKNKQEIEHKGSVLTEGLSKEERELRTQILLEKAKKDGK